MPGASLTAGSAVPPFFTTFFSGVAVEVLAAVFRRRRFLLVVWVGDTGFFEAASGFTFRGSSVASGTGVADGADCGSAPVGAGSCGGLAGAAFCGESWGELDGAATGGG
jgi:hypothetical protein